MPKKAKKRAWGEKGRKFTSKRMKVSFQKNFTRWYWRGWTLKTSFFFYSARVKMEWKSWNNFSPAHGIICYFPFQHHLPLHRRIDFLYTLREIFCLVHYFISGSIVPKIRKKKKNCYQLRRGHCFEFIVHK